MSTMKDFSWPTTSFNEKEYFSFVEIVKRNANHMRGRKIYIYGAGIRGCMFVEFCERLGIEVSGFYDGDSRKWGGTIKGRYIINKFNVDSVDNRYIIISTEMYAAIEKILKEGGLNEKDDYFYVKSVIYDDFVRNFFDKSDVKYTFMGDCIFSTVGIDDSCKASLESILNDQFSGEIDFISVHGMPMRTFYHMLRLRIKMGRVPSHLVVAVNTVMFAGKKNVLPRAQHTPLLEQINNMLLFEDEEFADYIELTRQRANRYNTDSFVSASGGATSKNAEIVTKIRMKQNYMYNLDLNNEGMIYLGEICKLCSEYQIDFVALLPPINYQRGLALFGEEFISVCDKNLEIIKQFVAKYGFECCDLSYLIESSGFASSDTINEITNYEGRIQEANFIYKWLEKERND